MTTKELDFFFSDLARKVGSGSISKKDALLKIDEKLFLMATMPHFDSYSKTKIFASGKAASYGAVVGSIYFSIEDCIKNRKKNNKVILFTENINNDHLSKFEYIDGIIATKEDLSSHAVIVARGMGKAFITNAETILFDGTNIKSAGKTISAGDIISLDAFNGNILNSEIKIQKLNPTKIKPVLKWIEEFLAVEVHGNADTIEEARISLKLKAVGIEPRTEHMFFHPDRLHDFRKMILAPDKYQKAAINKLQSVQEQDFLELYKLMGELPVIIRLLDPPLHEFLPRDKETIAKLSVDLKISTEAILNRISDLEERNPMMGHRGCRLLITNPELVKMQVTAIFNAALKMNLEGIKIIPKIIIPMVVDHNEIKIIKKIIKGIAKKFKITYEIGAMIETPRAALMSEYIAKEVDFVSFGTNDLTAQTFAFSRGDNYKKFLFKYLTEKIIEKNPFAELDVAVQELITISVDKLKKGNPKIHIGICGEQASARSSVDFCIKAGFTCLSVIPNMIPIVKLFAAQTNIAINY